MALDPLKHDDPRRVAPPYQAPGEVEPLEVSEAAAKAIILDAIATGQRAYGHSANELIDLLIDSFIHKEADVIEACQHFPEVERICGEIANECPEEI